MDFWYCSDIADIDGLSHGNNWCLSETSLQQTGFLFRSESENLALEQTCAVQTWPNQVIWNTPLWMAKYFCRVKLYGSDISPEIPMQSQPLITTFIGRLNLQLQVNLPRVPYSSWSSTSQISIAMLVYCRNCYPKFPLSIAQIPSLLVKSHLNPIEIPMFPWFSTVFPYVLPHFPSLFPPLCPAFSKAHHGAVLHQGQVQPAAAPAAPRGGAVLVAHLLQHFAHAHLGRVLDTHMQTMVLVYLPTKLGDFVRVNVVKYSSTMEYMG